MVNPPLSVAREVVIVQERDYWLPLTAAAKVAGLSRRTLWAYLRHPVTPLVHYRVGGKTLIRRSDLDQWMASFRAYPTQDVDRAVREILDDLKGGKLWNGKQGGKRQPRPRAQISSEARSR